MNEKPILFNAAMVQAILDGRKTQTRRVIKRLSWDCRYAVGDLLWVKEKWRVSREMDNAKPSEFSGWSVNYKDGRVCKAGFADTDWGRWRSPLFMPKWAARTWLEITRIRVKKVQDISPADSVREGVMGCTVDDIAKAGFPSGSAAIPIHAFRLLWDSINAKRGFSWETNPFVWVIEFKRKGED